MPLSEYDVSIGYFIRALRVLSRVLTKGEEYADSKGIPHSEMLESRLIDDMLSFVKQIQIACNTAKFTAVRLGGVENLALEDPETESFAELQSRIQTVTKFLEAVPRESMEGSGAKEIVWKSGNSAEFRRSGADYISSWALPNFMFHITTAYDLLRSKGVPLGKRDFLRVPGEPGWWEG